MFLSISKRYFSKALLACSLCFATLSAFAASEEISLQITPEQEFTLTLPPNHEALTAKQIPTLYDTFHRKHEKNQEKLLTFLAVKSQDSELKALYQSWIFVSASQNSKHLELDKQQFDNVKLKLHKSVELHNQRIASRQQAPGAEKVQAKTAAGDRVVFQYPYAIAVLRLRDAVVQGHDDLQVANINAYILVQGKLVNLNHFKYVAAQSEIDALVATSNQWIQSLLSANSSPKP